MTTNDILYYSIAVISAAASLTATWRGYPGYATLITCGYIIYSGFAIYYYKIRPKLSSRK